MIVSNQSALGYLVSDRRYNGFGYVVPDKRRRLSGFGDFLTDAGNVVGSILGGILGTNKNQPQTVPQYPPPPPPPNYTTPAIVLVGGGLGAIVLYKLLS